MVVSPGVCSRLEEKRFRSCRINQYESCNDTLRPVRFAILVNAAPYTHQASDTAYWFTKAALEKGHKVYRIFFYHDGVHNGTRLSVPPQDERDLSKQWGELAKQYGLDLVVCVSAAQRRGLLDVSEARRHGKDAANLAPAFRISGLGQLIEASIEADRLVVFGD
jgi:tRNA 2-thiouridine synthesizing protein D